LWFTILFTFYFSVNYTLVDDTKLLFYTRTRGFYYRWGAARRKTQIVNVTGFIAGKGVESLVSCKIGIHRGRETIQCFFQAN